MFFTHIHSPLRRRPLAKKFRRNSTYYNSTPFFFCQFNNFFYVIIFIKKLMRHKLPPAWRIFSNLFYGFLNTYVEDILAFQYCVAKINSNESNSVNNLLAFYKKPLIGTIEGSNNCIKIDPINSLICKWWWSCKWKLLGQF